MKTLISVLSFTFILSNLFGAGLSIKISELFEPLKNIKLVLRLLAINFILIPAGAYVLSILLKADSSLQAGIVIFSCCAGAPFMPKLAQTAKANVAHAVELMVLLLLSSLFFIPIILPLLISGIEINPLAIIKRLLFMMILPLFGGILINGWKPGIAKPLKKFLGKLSLVSLVLLIIPALYLDYSVLVSAYGTGIYNLVFLFTVFSIAAGYMLGGANRSEKIVSMIGAGTRNIPAALIIVIANFSKSREMLVVLIGSIMQLVILFTIAIYLSKKSTQN